MINYMKLELEKHNFKNYIKAALISNFAIVCIIILFNMFLKVETDLSLPTYAQLFRDIGDITKEVYIIFTAVMVSKIIIKEYREGTIAVLFTYPISRAKLLSSKILLIMIFTSLTVAISTFINIIILYLISSLSGFIRVALSFDDVINIGYYILINASLCSLLGMIPLFLAIKIKSESLMIFLVFIIITVDEFIALEQLIILASLGLVSILLAMWRINKIDVKA